MPAIIIVILVFILFSLHCPLLLSGALSATPKGLAGFEENEYEFRNM